MKEKSLGLLGFVTLGLFVCATPGNFVPLRAADQAAAHNGSSTLAKDLVGAWTFVSAPGETNAMPPNMRSIKILANGHWTVTYYQTNNGHIAYHHGGTYTVAGNTYAETVEYANSSTSNLLGQTFRFTVTVQGDKLNQVGLGNPWTENWQRAK